MARNRKIYLIFALTLFLGGLLPSKLMASECGDNFKKLEYAKLRNELGVDFQKILVTKLETGELDNADLLEAPIFKIENARYSQVLYVIKGTSRLYLIGNKKSKILKKGAPYFFAINARNSAQFQIDEKESWQMWDDDSPVHLTHGPIAEPSIHIGEFGNLKLNVYKLEGKDVAIYDLVPNPVPTAAHSLTPRQVLEKLKLSDLDLND